MSGPTSSDERAAGTGGDPSRSDTSRNAEAGNDVQLGADRPWPGLAAFGEAHRDFFHGRENESAEFLQLVRRELLTVLYGLSGLGKSSLLRAAVFPTLRAENGLPIYLRVDHDEASASPLQQIIETIRRAAERAGVEAPGADGVTTLWEYFHRSKTVSWNRQHDVVTPVLVFDQFEELFTLGRITPERKARTAELLTQLGDLIEGRTPASVKQRLDADPEAAEAYSFGQHLFRVVFSLREEFLPDLEDLREEIPSIANRMRLRHMAGDKALEVVLVPGGHLLTREVAEAIVRFVAGETRPPADAAPRPVPLNELSVEPALLSLFCFELNEERRQRGASRISMELLREQQASILEAYYERCMRDRPNAVRVFIEDELVTVSGYRNDAAVDDALAKGVTAGDIDILVDERRLLRKEKRGAVDRIELTHDVLTKVVCASRDERRHREALERAQREAARRRRQLAAAMTIAALFLVLSVALFVQWTNAKRTLALTHYREGLNQLDDGRIRAGAASLSRALRVYPENPITRPLLHLDASFIRTALLSSLLYTEWPAAILSHADDVTSAVFSADSRRALTASADGTARVWDAQTGAPIAELHHSESIYAAAFSRDGSRVVTASADGTAQVWDARTGARIGAPLQRANHRAIRSAAFSPDGTRVVTASEDYTAQLWDAATGAPVGEPLPHGDVVYTAVFSPDGQRIVTASADGTARLWDALSGAHIGEPLRHDGDRPVRSAAFSADGSRVVTASDDRTARLWDARTGTPIGAPLSHDTAVWSATLNANGTRLVTVSGDRSARLWDVQTGKLRRLQHGADVMSAAFSPDDRLVVTASRDGTARLWDAETGRPIGSPFRHEDAVWSAVFSPDGTQVITASKDHTARLWKAQPGVAAGQPLEYGEVVRSAIFSPDGARVVTAGEDHTARLWDAHTGQPSGQPLQHRDLIYSAAFSPDGALVLTASADGTARIWNARTGVEIGDALKHESGLGIMSAAFSPDGSRIVTASEDRSARLWDAHSRQPIGDSMEHDAWVTSAAFSPDGTRIVTASGNTARFWDAHTGAAIAAPVLAHDVRVWSAAFNADGTLVVTASADGTAQVWDARSGRQIGEPLRHGAGVRTAAFSPDGELVVTASADDTARLWDARTGTRVGGALPHGGDVVYAAFSPDGTRVVTAAADRTVRLWDVGPGAAISADELARFAETVAHRRLDDTGTATEISEPGNPVGTVGGSGAKSGPEEPLTVAGLARWFYADRATRRLSPRSVE